MMAAKKAMLFRWFVLAAFMVAAGASIFLVLGESGAEHRP